jgi:predicted RND superfamily exporter protein
MPHPCNSLSNFCRCLLLPMLVCLFVCLFFFPRFAIYYRSAKKNPLSLS